MKWITPIIMMLAATVCACNEDPEGSASAADDDDAAGDDDDACACDCSQCVGPQGDKGDQGDPGPGLAAPVPRWVLRDADGEAVELDDWSFAQMTQTTRMDGEVPPWEIDYVPTTFAAYGWSWRLDTGLPDAEEIGPESAHPCLYDNNGCTGDCYVTSNTVGINLPRILDGVYVVGWGTPVAGVKWQIYEGHCTEIADVPGFPLRPIPDAWLHQFNHPPYTLAVESW